MAGSGGLGLKEHLSPQPKSDGVGLWGQGRCWTLGGEGGPSCWPEGKEPSGASQQECESPLPPPFRNQTAFLLTDGERSPVTQWESARRRLSSWAR